MPEHRDERGMELRAFSYRPAAVPWQAGVPAAIWPAWLDASRLGLAMAPPSVAWPAPAPMPWPGSAHMERRRATPLGRTDRSAWAGARDPWWRTPPAHLMAPSSPMAMPAQETDAIVAFAAPLRAAATPAGSTGRFSPQHVRAVAPHIHQMRGITSFDAGHIHRYDVAVGPAWPDAGSHVHHFEGLTTADSGHRHHFSGVTGPARSFFLGGHHHSFSTETTPADTPRRHSHVIRGRTNIHGSLS